MKVSNDDIVVNRAEFNLLKEELRSAKETIISLNEKVAELYEKLAKFAKTSANSSKPPSSDIVKQNRNSGNKSGSKKGGQPGHPKHERESNKAEDVNFVHEYNLAQCPVCQNSVDIDLSKEPRIIQQAEIVEIPVQIEEHKAHAYWCSNCQKYHYADFPAAVVKEGLFKAKITALVAYMKHVCHCSFSNIKRYFRDVLKLKISTGYLSKIIQKVSKCLEGSYNELLNILPLSLKVNVDETGHKENGEKFWTWVFRTDLFVLFKIDKSRSSKVLLEILGAEFNGILGCDYFSAYRKYMKDFNVTIQFCIAHLIRDIKYLCSLRDKESKAYGEKLLQGMQELFKIIHEKSSMSKNEFNDKLNQAKNQIIKIATLEAPSYINNSGKVERREAKNMVKRFVDNGEAYFQFITTPGVEPTNNIAEQAVRFVVIDRLVTQGTRSIKGRTANERLWTVIATCSLQGRSAYEFILKSVQAYFYEQSSPSLITDTG